MRTATLSAVSDERPVTNTFIREHERLKVGEIVPSHVDLQNHGTCSRTPPGELPHSQICPRPCLVEPSGRIKTGTKIRSCRTNQGINPVCCRTDRYSDRVLRPQRLVGTAVEKN